MKELFDKVITAFDSGLQRDLEPGRAALAEIERECNELRAKLAKQVQVSARLSSERACEMVRADTAVRKLAACERQEPVATVCLVTDRFAHKHCMEVQLQIPQASAQLPIGTKLYANPLALREPTEEECANIAWAQKQMEFIDISDLPTSVKKGRAMWQAVREVMK